MLDKQIIKKINAYYSYCKAKHYAHLKAAEKYKILYNYTNSPIIVLSSITTLLASYNINTSYPYLVIITALLSGVITIAHALTSFFEFNIKYENCLKTSNKYIDLVWFIENEFFLKYYTDDEINEEYVINFFENIHKRLNSIQNNEPCLPPSIADQNYLNDYYGLNDISDELIDSTPVTIHMPNPIRNNPNIRVVNDVRSTSII